MATTDWVRLHYPSGLYRRSTSAYVEGQVSGLFRICRVEFDNNSIPVLYSQLIFAARRSLARLRAAALAVVTHNFEWNGYPTVKKFRIYVYSFRQNSRT